MHRFDQPTPVDESELPLKLPDMDNFAPGNDPQGACARVHACVFGRAVDLCVGPGARDGQRC